MNYEKFKAHIKGVSAEFQKADKKHTIRLISHLDADGLSACSIMIRALNQDNRKYSISIIQQLDLDIIKELSREDYACFIFTDLGSGKIDAIRQHFKNKKVFVLDHHKPESDFMGDENIRHVNPHLFGIDGSKEISGAGIVYFFAKSLDEKNESMAHIAIIGAIGDLQEECGFLKLNREILETAEKKGKIIVTKGLRFFGAQTRPLHKLLEYSTDPYIPGVTGSETGAIHFLQQIGIEPKKGEDWKKLMHLNDAEIKKLVASIVLRRANESKPEDVLGNIYILPEEKEESPLRDAREFSTLLNACGRLRKASLGVGACLGDKKAKIGAIKILNNYRKEVLNSLKWFEKNKQDEDIFIENGLVIINARDNVLGTMAGTLASILAKSGEFKDGTMILSLAYLDNYIKASLRVSGNANSIDLREVVKKITDKIGGEAGGHYNAAGALIPLEKESEFLKTAKEILGKICLEEEVL